MNILHLICLWAEAFPKNFLFSIRNVAAVCSRAAYYKGCNSYHCVLLAFYELVFMTLHDMLWPFPTHG